MSFRTFYKLVLNIKLVTLNFAIDGYYFLFPDSSRNEQGLCVTMLYCLLDNGELRHFESLNFGSPEPDPSLQKQFEMLVYSFVYNILSS